MSHTYTQITYRSEQGYPYISLRINGQRAKIIAEQTNGLVQQKKLFVGSDVETNSGTGYLDDSEFFDTVFMPFAVAVKQGRFREGVKISDITT